MYTIIGKMLTFLLALSVVSIFFAFYVSRGNLKNHSFSANVAAKTLDFFYKPMLAAYMFLFKSPDKLHERMSVLKNEAHRDKFQKTEKRIIIAPHCIRHMECPARTTRHGIQCTSCGKCDYAEIKKIAEKNGYILYIVTGSSFVRHILSSEEAKTADGVLAIGCYYELNKGARELRKSRTVTYGIPLLSTGCYNMKIDMILFEKELRRLHPDVSAGSYPEDFLAEDPVHLSN
ncbi:DUF116 domain-containing protein [Methanolapillus millepedarum]|uniref:DUF116 domain-containing protein n=1 Tax=Methanolapillus millepedarum TaxID=3028296 RepID=A0AA96V228_9EURY|nr:hypothetical protein MsAc7_00300 [Methanosarcinaceae archaeon Ac7]